MSLSLASTATRAAKTRTCACPEALIPADQALMERLHSQRQCPSLPNCEIWYQRGRLIRFGSQSAAAPSRSCSRAESWVTICLYLQNKDELGGRRGEKKGEVARAALPSGWVHGRVWACSTQVRSTLGPHSAYSAWVSTFFFSLFLPHPHLLTLLLLPCLAPAPHMRSFFFLPHCNSCRSSSVSRRDKLKEDSHMALSHLSRGPHESQ